MNLPPTLRSSSAPSPDPSQFVADGSPAWKALRSAALLVALAALLAHAGFGMDAPKWVGDFEAINYDDPQVLQFARERSIREIVTSPTYYAYKPVYFLSLKVDTWLPGDAVAVGHVVNWLLHGLAAFLLVVLLGGVLGNLWIAGAAGLLFAVHPVHVESVAWLAERKDVLSLVLVLLAHLAYRRGRERGSWMLAPAVLLLLAGLTKGTVWTYAGVLALDEAISRAPWRAALRRLAPSLLVGVGGVVLDLLVGMSHGPGSVEHGVSTLALAAAMARVHLEYVASVLVPVGFSLDYAVSPDGSWTSPLAWLGLLLAVGAVVLLVLAWRRGFRLGALAAGIWVLGLLPVNNVFPRTTALRADRYLYLPAIGLYLLLAWAIARLPRARTPILATAVVLLAVLAGLRTRVFASSETVWADAVEKHPESALAWIQRGQAAAARGEHVPARAHAEKAIALAPRPELLVRARLLLADALFLRAKGARDEATARDLLRVANEAATAAADLTQSAFVRGDPSALRAEAEVKRGNALELLGDPASALEAYRRAVELDPESFAARYNLGTTLAGAGRADAMERAVPHLREALRLNPDYLDASLQLATVLQALGQGPEALRILDRAEERHGRIPDLLYARAQALLTVKSDLAAAEKLLAELRQRDPGHPKGSRLYADIRLARGNDLLEKGREEKDRKSLLQALEWFDEAKKSEPGRVEPWISAGDALLLLNRFAEARERYLRAAELSTEGAWLQALAARTGVLHAAWLARHAENDADRLEAARRMAVALDGPVTRVDLGFLPLEGELPAIRRLSVHFAAGDEPAASIAAAGLRAAALAVAGDEQPAMGEIRAGMAALPATDPPGEVLEGLVLLRALLRERAREHDAAREDYTLLASRRPDDTLPPLRLLTLDFRLAQARLSTALGFREDQPRLEAATAASAEAAGRLSAFADAHPEDLEAGLRATEAEMQSQAWVSALKRLNDLATRYPGSASVERGRSAVYVSQYMVLRERELLTEATQALQRALALDPRDARTHLDASGVARIAGDRRSAIRHASRAMAYELGASGPASRTLAVLLVAMGREMLEAGKGDAAVQVLEQARRADPGAAAPWVLEAEIRLAQQDLNAALKAGTKAQELEPASREADELLGKVRYQRASRAHLLMAAEKDPAKKALLRQTAAKEFREALLADPEGERAPDIRERLKSLEANDPEAQRRAAQEAEARYEEAQRLLAKDRRSEALEALRDVLRLDPDHRRAHVYLVKTVCELLGPLSNDPLETRYVSRAFASLHALDRLDPEDRFALRHYYRGWLNERLWRRQGMAEARVLAEQALKRFVLAQEAAGKADDPLVADARRRLEGLAKGLAKGDANGDKGDDAAPGEKR